LMRHLPEQVVAFDFCGVNIVPHTAQVIGW
jgi:hypothetical protein